MSINYWSSLHILAKLIHVIRHCLNACIRKAIRECQEDGEEREKENVSVSGHVALMWTGRAFPLAA